MHSHGGFFDVDPIDDPRPEPYRRPAWIGPPEDELPGRVLLDDVVASTEGTVVILSELSRYESGISIRLSWMRRRRGESVKDWNFAMMARHGGGPDEPGSLRIGIVLPDGTRLLPIGWHRLSAPDDVKPPTLFTQDGGGGGGEDRYDGSITAWTWWPDATTGDLVLVLEWPDTGIPETHVTIPAETRALAAKPRSLWSAL